MRTQPDNHWTAVKYTACTYEVDAVLAQIALALGLVPFKGLIAKLVQV
jgi:hypothetical protein